jgi:uracil-DNA glycosylase family 4
VTDVAARTPAEPPPGRSAAPAAPASAAPAPAAPAAGLAELAGRIRGCRACAELAAARTNAVPGEFPPGAELLLVGEAPGRAEDASGRPFVGRAGGLLDELLASAGLRRGSGPGAVAVANTLKCRPPANRAPTRSELANCRGWLEAQLHLADPQVVVALGATAAGWAFGGGRRLADLRETPRLRDGRVLLATYHPSAALRFGPAGQPRAALAADLRAAAGCAERIRRGEPVIGAVDPADADAVLRLTRSAFATHPPLDPPFGTLRETVDRVAADLAASPALGALVGGRLVGVLRTASAESVQVSAAGVVPTAQGRPGRRQLAAAGAELWLRRLAVDPAAMGRGLGTALVRATHDWATAHGYTATRAGVRTPLERNHRFWRRHGYLPVAEHEVWTEYRRPLTR